MHPLKETRDKTLKILYLLDTYGSLLIETTKLTKKVTVFQNFEQIVI